MATYQAVDITKSVPSDMVGANYFGTVAPGVTTATGDVLNPCKIAAGVVINALLINVRTAYGATAPASIGLTHTDGTAVPASVTATPITCIAAATDTSHASTGTKLVMPSGGPITTDKDCFLSIVFGTIATGASGVSDYCVLGEFRGSL